VDEVDAVFAEAVDFLAVVGGEVEWVPACGAGGDVDGDGFEGADDGVVGVAGVGDGDVCSEDIEPGGSLLALNCINICPMCPLVARQCKSDLFDLRRS